MSTRTTLAGFGAGAVVGSLAAYYFAIRPLTIAAELSAQAGFMLLRAKMREDENRSVSVASGSEGDTA